VRASFSLGEPACRCGCTVREVFGTIPTANIPLKFATVVRGLSKMAKTKCYFDIEIGKADVGRLIIEVSRLKIA